MPKWTYTIKEGCLEHSFLIESILEDSKRRRKDVRIVWLDLEMHLDRFHTIHCGRWWMCWKFPYTLLTSARRSTIIQAREWEVQMAKLIQGIKQGCPLSPLLFNLVLEGVLPHVEKMDGGYKFSNATKVNILAYADDICAIGKTKEEIERMLKRLYEFTQWAGLHFNPAKCGCLSMINHNSRKYGSLLHVIMCQNEHTLLKKAIF